MSIEVCITQDGIEVFANSIEECVKIEGSLYSEYIDKKMQKNNKSIQENTKMNINLNDDNKYKSAYEKGIKNMNNSDFINALYLIQTYCDHKTEYGFIEKKYEKDGKKRFTLAKGRRSGPGERAGIYLNRLCYAEEDDSKNPYYTVHSHPSIGALSFEKDEPDENRNVIVLNGNTKPQEIGDIVNSKESNKNMYVITSDGEIYFTTPDLAEHGRTYKTEYEVRIYGQVYLGKMSKNNNQLMVTLAKQDTEGRKEYLIDIKSEKDIFHNYNNPVHAFADCKHKDESKVRRNCKKVSEICRKCSKASQDCYDDYKKCDYKDNNFYEGIIKICNDCNKKILKEKCINCNYDSSCRGRDPYSRNCSLLACLKSCSETDISVCEKCIYIYGGR